MTPRTADVVARVVNAHNARTHRTADRAAGVVLALVLGIVGVCLLVHYPQPCPAGTLCAASLVPTRSSWALRLHRALARAAARVRAWELRWRLRWVEEDLQCCERELATLPRDIDWLRVQVDSLRVDIASADLDSRAQ